MLDEIFDILEQIVRTRRPVRIRRSVRVPPVAVVSTSCYCQSLQKEHQRHTSPCIQRFSREGKCCPLSGSGTVKVGSPVSRLRWLDRCSAPTCFGRQTLGMDLPIKIIQCPPRPSPLLYEYRIVIIITKHSEVLRTGSFGTSSNGS
jgi:hypothetical protein